MGEQRTLNFYQADVFTTQPFGGNPVAVFPEADGLKDDELQQIAREMNLSETVFVFHRLTLPQLHDYGSLPQYRRSRLPAIRCWAPSMYWPTLNGLH